MIDARFPFCSNINFAVRNRARCHAVTNGEKISLSSFMDYFELNLLVCVRQNLMSKLRNWLSVLCTASVS